MSTVPLTTVMQSRIDRISHATSSQLALLRETERAVTARRVQIEQSCAATALAPRPLAGESRPRELPPPPPPPPARRRAAGGAAIVARPPLGTVTLIAGQEERGFEDGPALSARFWGPIGMVKTSDGALSSWIAPTIASAG